MFKRLFFMLSCLTGALLLSGCASFRVVTDMKPAANPELKSPAGTFYVADFKLVPDQRETAPNIIGMWKKYQQEALPLLKKECVSRYPALFSTDATASIPLCITVETTQTRHELKTMCWMFGTLMVCGSILPLPGGRDEDILLKAYVGTGPNPIQTTTVQKNFRREFHGWMSLLTPSALIPIPGDSDLPKVSATVLNSEKVFYLQPLTTQIVTALAETLATTAPEFWTAQPRQGNSSTLSPGHPVITPPVPVPTDTVSPF